MVFILGVVECFLQAYAYGINVGIEKLDDMEHVYADGDIREAAFCQGNESAVHVAGKELYFLSLGKIKGKEIWHEVVKIRLGRISTTHPASPSAMLQWKS